MELGIKNKVAVVLAASKGLGRAAAETLAAEGVRVVIGSRNKEDLEKTAQEISEKTGSQVIGIPVDVTNAAQAEDFIAKAAEHFGQIDILVNNAGGPPFGPVESFDESQWQAAFELNLLSTVRITRLVLPHLKKTGSGRIINIVSMSVKSVLDNSVLSTSIRMGVVGMAKMLADEVGPDQITVNNVCPGMILTDRIRSSGIKKELEAGMTEEEALQSRAKNIPLRRIGKPEELAALIAFLASEKASYITGTTIQVDGGVVRSIF
ncbi:SDR family oxidoreductase [Mucilaginibacter arboris]|uniref:SDR family oxidoreductase n=1 Tax=Mucilaginibacter arboris TaxID=2682090 RepID=A0A7K1SV66_9SPHI|nr:SDR family oxidoreductase [Mucilaginibacter arboris]MVN21221.1 SDR family oxidoreductase [Mucilaginibacter arboris]